MYVSIGSCCILEGSTDMSVYSCCNLEVSYMYVHVCTCIIMCECVCVFGKRMLF